MVYRAIGIMSGSSLDGLDLAFTEFHEQGGKWNYEIKLAECVSYPADWVERLKNAVQLDARNYQLLHCAYGHFIGEQVNLFIEKHQLQFKAGLISSHGHTSFHMPAQRMTAQLGDGAAIAAATKLPVVTDLRAMDVAFGGQGAPIVPIGEKYLLGDYQYFLNLGGIANISANEPDRYIAFDICAANRVLNMIANLADKDFDDKGEMARAGLVHVGLLNELNELDYYRQSFPKSLANDFGTDVVFPLIKKAGLSVTDALSTYTEPIAFQVSHSLDQIKAAPSQSGQVFKLLITGGGAFNQYLVERISELVKNKGIETIVPEQVLVNFKEAMIMAFIGVLRWRQEYNVLATVTGAARDSIGGALWSGEEA
jgi:anhydro-N-acetylmuramic acid kinase